MNMLAQIRAVTWIEPHEHSAALRHILVIVVGIAGVVAVLISVLAMATGFNRTIMQPDATIARSCCAAARIQSSRALFRESRRSPSWTRRAFARMPRASRLPLRRRW